MIQGCSVDLLIIWLSPLITLLPPHRRGEGLPAHDGHRRALSRMTNRLNRPHLPAVIGAALGAALIRVRLAMAFRSMPGEAANRTRSPASDAGGARPSGRAGRKPRERSQQPHHDRVPRTRRHHPQGDLRRGAQSSSRVQPHPVLEPDDPHLALRLTAPPSEYTAGRDQQDVVAAIARGDADPAAEKAQAHLGGYSGAVHTLLKAEHDSTC